MRRATPGLATRAAADDFLNDDAHRDSPDQAASQDRRTISGYTLQFGDAPLTPCDKATADDRAWFARHFGRNHRIRSPIGREREIFAGGPRRLKPFVVVRQVEPGARIRLPARAPQRPLNSEDLGRRLFDQLAADWPLCARVEALARAGVI